MVDDRIAAMIVPVHHDEITNSRIIGHSYRMIAKLARYFRPFFSLTCYQLVESFFLGCDSTDRIFRIHSGQYLKVVI